MRTLIIKFNSGIIRSHQQANPKEILDGLIRCGQTNAIGHEEGESTRGLLGFTSAILEHARGPPAGHGTVDLVKIDQ